MNNKHIKTGIYLLLLVFLFITSLLVFNYMSNIFNAFESTAQYSEVQKQIQTLYILITLSVAIPFIFILTLLFISFFNNSIELKSVGQEESFEKLEEQKRKKEKKNDDKEQEKIEKQAREKEYKEKTTELKDCLKQKINKKKSAGHKQLSEKILSCISKQYEIVQGEIYLLEKKDKKDMLTLSSTYAYYIPEEKVFEFEIGEGLIGQVGKAKESLALNEIPEGYIQVTSGLGSSTPSNLIIIPMVNENDELIGVYELAAFKEFNENDKKLLEDIGSFICQFYKQNEK